MATTCGVSVTKTAGANTGGQVYTITSSDATNGVGWQVTTDQWDWVDDLSAIKNKIWNEVLRQIKQL